MAMQKLRQGPVAYEIRDCGTVFGMNPYASQLGSRNPVEVIAATAKRLDQLAKALGSERVNESLAPGKWTVREIICHLADCEIVFAFRLRQSLAEERHVMQPFDQDQFAKQYDAYDTGAALAMFAAVRNWNLKFIQALTAQQLAKVVNHPERGDMTIQTIVETMAGHDLNHLQQLDAITTRHAAA
jgi:hypothetical protein